MKAACSGWYQVPLLYSWQNVVGSGVARRRTASAPS